MVQGRHAVVGCCGNDLYKKINFYKRNNMHKLLLLILILYVAEGNSIGLQFTGVKTVHKTDKGKPKRITIERKIDSKCLNIPVSNHLLRAGNYAHTSVPDACKSTFVTSAGGVIFPMKLHERVETYGEIEVLAFIKKMQRDHTMLLIDTRGEEWYTYNTIPGAVNIHYVYFTKPDVFQKEFNNALKQLGVKRENESYDFTHAKTIALFCNGAWCAQSPNMIKALMKLGYPPQKIKWYRGGMDDWLGMSMTTSGAR